MQLIDGKKILLILLLLVCCFANSTCKKITKYPVNMAGVWISGSRCQMSIEITKGGYGIYKSNSPDKGCGSSPVKGKVKFTGSHLYIGLVKFKFIAKPEIVNSGDSVFSGTYYHELNRKSKLLATMTLQNSKLYTGEIITYSKITEL